MELAQEAKKSSKDKRFGFLPIAVLAAIFLVGFYLRLVFLRLPYWFDEANTIYYISQSFSRMIEFIKLDFSPPLYLLVLKSWVSIFGNSEIATGTLSLIFSLLTLPLVYLLGKKLYNKKVGIIAAAIFWSSPLLIFQSTNTRMYSLVVFLATLSCLFLFNIFQKLGWLNFLGYIFISVLGLYTHTTYAFFILAQVVAWFIFSKMFTQKNFYRNWILTYLAIGVGYLPWLPTFLKQLTQSNNGYLYWTDFINDSSYFALGDLLVQATILFDNSLFKLMVASFIVYSLFLAFKINQKEDKEKNSLVFLVFLIIVPLLIVALAGILINKFVIYIFPLFFILLAQGISKIKVSSKILSLVGVVIILISSLNVYQSFREFKLSSPMFLTPKAVDYLKDNMDRQSSSIILTDGHVEQALLKYYSPENFNITGVFPNSLIENNDWELSYIKYNGQPVISQGNVSEIDENIKDFESIWLISFTDQKIYDPFDLTRQRLQNNCKLEKEKHFPENYFGVNKIKIFLFKDCKIDV